MAIVRLLLVIVLVLPMLAVLSPTTIVRADTQVLRPMGDTDDVTMPNQTPNDGLDHYLKVDEAVHDGGATTVSTTSRETSEATRTKDLYEIEDIGDIGDAITSIAVTYVASTNPGEGNVKTVIWVDGDEDKQYYGGYQYFSDAVWRTRITTWTTNPDTSLPWTWDDVDNLEAGISARVYNAGDELFVTQFYITVTYTPITLPIVTTNPATNVGTTTARLNGQLNDDGGDTTLAFLYWDTVDHGATFAWTNAESLDETAEGSFYADISGLPVATTHYFRAYGNNSLGGSWAASSRSFTTPSNIGAPTAFTAWPSSAEPTINLSWITGANSTATRIQYSTTGYLGCTGNGTIIFDGRGAAYEHTNLTPGDTVYYTIHGMSGTTDSDTCAEAMATVSLASLIPDITIGDTPTNWFLSSDYTRMSNLPFYGIINDCSDSIGMNRQAFWYSLGMYVALLVFVGTYWMGRNLVMSGLAAIIVLGISGPMGLIPGYQVMLFGMFGTGLGFAIRRI